MSTIEKDYFLAVPPALVWEALTEPIQINAWGAGPNAEITLEEGGVFNLWDGDIHGTVQDFDVEKRLVQEWYTNGYEYATEVTFTLDAEEDGTRLSIIQTGVAEEDLEEFDRGWDEYYVGPLKEFCEQQGA